MSQKCGLVPQLASTKEQEVQYKTLRRAEHCKKNICIEIFNAQRDALFGKLFADTCEPGVACIARCYSSGEDNESLDMSLFNVSMQAVLLNVFNELCIDTIIQVMDGPVFSKQSTAAEGACDPIKK